MEKLTYNQIVEQLKNSGMSVNDFAYEDYSEENSLPSWEEVDQEGGEDEGSHWHSVKYFKDHDVYIKVTGWYSSYNGTDFENWDNACSEVRPQQKTITVWE
jgi:hypothetical protein